MIERPCLLVLTLLFSLSACGGDAEEAAATEPAPLTTPAEPGPAKPDAKAQVRPKDLAQAQVRPEDVAQAVDPTRDIVIDFDPDEPGIYLSVEFEGPDGQRKQLDYLFDSGASFLTISTATARELGIEIAADAPQIEFHTAAGPRSSPMVRLPALTIGDVRIPNLAVSICDPCATERGGGLLGLNVIREFVVQTDYQSSQMKLLPRVHGSRINRAYDIQPMVELAIDGPAQIRETDIDWEVSLVNRSPVAIEGAIPRVNFKNGKQLLGEPVPRIEPGHSGRSRVRGQALQEGEDGDELSYTLSLVEAYW